MLNKVEVRQLEETLGRSKTRWGGCQYKLGGIQDGLGVAAT